MEIISKSYLSLFMAVLEQHKGKEMSLDDIYAEIDGHKKAKSNEHWQAKVRQTLQQLAHSQMAVNTARGRWAMAA